MNGVGQSDLGWGVVFLRTTLKRGTNLLLRTDDEGSREWEGSTLFGEEHTRLHHLYHGLWHFHCLSGSYPDVIRVGSLENRRALGALRLCIDYVVNPACMTCRFTLQGLYANCKQVNILCWVGYPHLPHCSSLTMRVLSKYYLSCRTGNHWG